MKKPLVGIAALVAADILLFFTLSREAYSAVVLLEFLPLLGIGAATTVIRGFRYWLAHEPLPRLLVRDMISRTGLAVPLIMLFGIRVVIAIGGPIDGLATHPLWVLSTTLPAILSVAVYAYYEVFVLDGPDRVVHKMLPSRLSSIESKLDENIDVSKDAFNEANHANTKITELKSQFNDLLEAVLTETRQRNAITDARYATTEARAVTADRARAAASGVLDATADQVNDLHVGNAPPKPE